MFVSKLNATGPGLVYSTLLGGSDPTFDESGQGIVVDADGPGAHHWLSFSNDFPTKDPVTSPFATIAAFVTKFNAAGSALVYSTGIGGFHQTFIMSGTSIALDGAGNVYVTGEVPRRAAHDARGVRHDAQWRVSRHLRGEAEPGVAYPDGHRDTHGHADDDGFGYRHGDAESRRRRASRHAHTHADAGHAHGHPDGAARRSAHLRPPVTVQVVPGTAGQLQVTIAATANPHSSNQPRAAHFGAVTNARIDIPGGPENHGSFSYSVPGSPQSITFTVRRATSGQATHVDLTVVDGCGSWPTFVGGGASGLLTAVQRQPNSTRVEGLAPVKPSTILATSLDGEAILEALVGGVGDDPSVVKLLDRAERPVALAIVEDALGVGGADAWQSIELRRRRCVDVQLGARGGLRGCAAGGTAARGGIRGGPSARRRRGAGWARPLRRGAFGVARALAARGAATGLARPVPLALAGDHEALAVRQASGQVDASGAASAARPATCTASPTRLPHGSA